MRKLKLFFACLLMAVLSIGQVWAAENDTHDFAQSGGNQGLNNCATINGASIAQQSYPVKEVIVSYAYNKTNSPTCTVTVGGVSWGTKTLSKTTNLTTTTTLSFTGSATTGAVVVSFANDPDNCSSTGRGSVNFTNVRLVEGASGSTPQPTLSSVAVSGTPSTKTYEAGEAFDVTGLVVTGTYSDDSQKTETSGVTWTACKTENGSYVALDNAAVALAANETGIYVKATVSGKTSPAYHVTGLTVTAVEEPTLTFDFSTKGYTNGERYSPINADAKITFLFGDNDGKYYNTGTAMRVYSSGHMTVAGGEGVTISKILLEFGASDGSNTISTNVGTYENAKWTGSAQSVTFNVGGTSGHRRIKVVKVFYEAEAIAVAQPTIEGETPFLNTTTVTLTQADADAIYYTTNGNEPTIDNNLLYSNPFTLDANKTVKAIAVKGGVSSSVAEKAFSKIETKTVAQAIAAIPNQDDVVNNQYVEGFVCTAGTSVNNSGQMTYYISDDGSETARLQIYLGKNLNNTAFAAANDLALGDKVIVYGQLKNYKGTKEMNSGNYIVSKVAAAVVAPVFSPNGGGFMGETDVTITCETEGSAIYYTLDGTTPTKSSSVYGEPIHLNATTTITAVAYVGDDASLVIAKTFTLTAPMTVADALTALDTEDPINNVAVAGIISTAPTANPSSGKLTYYISDDGSDTDELEVYLGYGLNGASFSNKTDLQVGDEVTVFGNLTIFNSTTKEFASGSRLLAFNRPEVAVTGIDLTESTAEVEKDKTVTLHASVVPANATNKTIVWSVQSGNDKASVADGVVTGIAAGTAVIRATSDEDATIFAECTVTVTEPAPLSPWATTYTSNVAMAHTGSGVDNGTITIGTDDPYLLVKAGASSSTGTIVVTVPKGTTDLHFHAFAWGGKTAKIELAGVENASVSNFDLAGEAGASGSGNDFTLQGDPVDQYFHVSFDAVAAVTEITFSKATGSADNRFFFYGVNQEGGVVPVLKSIAISGDLDNKSYKAGQALDMTGLTVTATYQLGEETPYNVDITNDPGLSWTYDPLVENQDEVTVTAHFGDPEKTASKTIEGLTVASADPKIYVSTLNVNFASVEVGESVPAAETVTVTLTNVASVTATLGGTNADAFSVSPASLTESGDITISILANTDAAASYAATLTISDGEGGADDKVVNLSFTVNDPVTPEDPEVRKTWDLSIASYDANPTENQVKWSATYVNMVVDKYNATTKANNYLGGDANNRTSSRFYQNSKLTITPNGKEITSVVFTATSTGYANALQGSEWTNASASVDGTTVTVTPTDGKNAIIAVVGGTCGFTAVQVNYKNITPEPPTPTYETVREGLTAGNYYTICYPKAMTDVQGATLWSFVGKDANFAYIEQETATTIEAGKPYIMYATESTVTAVLGDETNAPGANGAIHGTFSNLTQDQLNNYATVAGNDLYLVIGNELRRATGEGTGSNTLPAQRAFVVLGEIPAASAHMPAHVRAMPMHKDTATGLDALNASDKPVKMVINGQLFILRGEKLYDATGRLVK